MEYGVLGSGSTGNGIWLDHEAALLVDCGLSVRTSLARMRALGVDPTRLSGIVLTHEHGDHAGGAARLARRMNVPVLATPGTFDGMRDTDGIRRIPITPGRVVDHAGFRLSPFAVAHDARQPIGLRIEAGGAAFGVLTDAGRWDEGVVAALSDLDAVYVESNHDDDLLETGPYPAPLKRRIRGGHGHLSNHACGRLLRSIVGPRTRRIVLGHLSLTNNTPALALATNHAALGRSGARVPDLVVAPAFDAVGPFSC